MTVAPEKFIAARKASGMTLSAASELANVTVQTYIAREKHPEQFRICELEGVYEGLNKTGKSLLREGMCELRLTQFQTEKLGHKPKHRVGCWGVGTGCRREREHRPGRMAKVLSFGLP